jgi:hypothetical protein
MGSAHVHETDVLSEIAANLDTVRARIAAAARECGRDPAAVGLVAVSKFQPPERILAALEAGHRLYGENRVQEAAGRWPDLKARYPDVRVHLVGPLQTNKVRDAVGLFDVIETVDRPKLVDALAAETDRQGRRPDCLIQVNTGEEAQKAGVAPDGLTGLLARCRDAGLPIAGLMCIPPVGEAPAPHFALLADLAHGHGLPVLSMGMSGDYETAVHQGATLVRVGTAIFGERVR